MCWGKVVPGKCMRISPTPWSVLAMGTPHLPRYAIPYGHRRVPTDQVPDIRSIHESLPIYSKISFSVLYTGEGGTREVDEDLADALVGPCDGDAALLQYRGVEEHRRPPEHLACVHVLCTSYMVCTSYMNGTLHMCIAYSIYVSYALYM